MTKTITNKAFAFVVAIVTVFSLSLMTLSTVNAGDNDALAALLLGLGLTQEQVDTVIASMGGSSTGDEGSSSASCGTTETYVHHPGIDYEFTKFMKKGSRGTEVEMLQKVLNVANGTSISEDGVFGNGTKNAVMTFQAANGLGADGVVGAMSRAELNKKTSTTVECEEEEGGEGEGEEGNATEDKLTVSGLASDDMVVGTNQTITVSKLTVTAGSKDVKVKNVLVKYTGTADESDVIDKVALLDSAMLELDTDNLNSDEEGKLKADKVVKAGESTTLYVAMKTSSAFSHNGLDGSLKVTEITTDGADVEGTPIMGASHEFNDGVSVDVFDAEITQDETGTVKIGEEAVKVATLNIENRSTSDDQETVKSIKLKRTGTAGDDALSNVKIKVGGEKYSSTQDDDEYVFSFGDGVVLTDRGDDKDFVVYADIEDDSTKTFAFEVTDIVVVDENGIFLSQEDSGAPAGNADEIAAQWDYGASVVTIALSEISISKTTDVQSDKIAAGQNDAELVSFDVEVTGKDVEGDLEVTVVASGDANIEGAADGTAGSLDLKDIDLENVVVYTKDGDRVSEKEDTSFAVTPTDGTLDQVTYTITFDDVKFDEGDDAVDYVIKGNVNKDATDGVKYAVSQIKYVSIEDEAGEDISDVTESISGVEMEVEAADIEVSIEEADDTDVNADANDVEVAQIKLDASNSGDDINVTQIKVQFAVTDGDLSGTTVSDLRNCELFDGSSSVSNKEDAAAAVTYDVDLTVTKDTEKTLLVKCDINNDFTNNDVITVTGVSFDARGVHTDADLDATFTNAKTVTVTTGSSVFTLASDDANDDKVVRDTTDDVILGVYEFKAKDAELNIDDITVTFTDNAAAKDISAVIDGKVDVYINGSKEESETPTSTVTFSNLSKAVAKDETVTITFKADMNTADTFGIDTVAMTTEEGVAVTTIDTNGANNYDGPEVEVVTALPVVTQVNADITDLSTSNDVTLFGYAVKAEGGDVVLSTTTLKATFNNASIANAKVKVYDNAAMTGSAKVEIDTTQAELTAGHQYTVTSTISENDTYYVFVVADVDVSGDARSIRVQMNDDATGVVFTTPALTGDKVMEGDMKSLLKQD